MFRDNAARCVSADCHGNMPAEDNQEITLPSPSAFQTTS